MRFYLGTGSPSWLNELTDIPLFVSYTRLRRIKRTFPQAQTRWAMDSGGFSQLSQHGAWQWSAEDYAAFADFAAQEIGKLDWCAPMDWMCEPWVLKKTGLCLRDHQARTIDSFVELRGLLRDAHVIPVLQGWQQADYHRHLEQYARRGIDLTQEPVVGLGSVCRRQASKEANSIVWGLADCGLKLHGFGFKTKGLMSCTNKLVSADSMAWTVAARYDEPLPGCTHKNCASCQKYALQWYERVSQDIEKAKVFTGFGKRKLRSVL